MNRKNTASYLCLSLVLALCGCLPSSCTKIESRELYPADSLSRALASSIVEDTLFVFGLSFGQIEEPLQYPRTLTFDETGDLLISDVGRGNIISISGEGAFLNVFADSFGLPFVIGILKDTTFVFEASNNTIVSLADNFSESVELSGVEIPEASVRYASVADSLYFLKVIPNEGRATLSVFNRSGAVLRTDTLHGPAWQWAGFLRPQPSSVLSLRGYQPQIDMFDAALDRDSLSLIGFDSPMLARTRSYIMGDVKAPPLLTASAAVSNEKYFVLNLRPGWTRIDVFGKDGTLTNILIRENPSFNKDFFPTDIAVHETSPGHYLIAVSYVKPDPRVETYAWTDFVE